MKTAHPYQNVLFQCACGRSLDRKYEMDYWGLKRQPRRAAGNSAAQLRANITIAHLGISSVNQAFSCSRRGTGSDSKSLMIRVTRTTCGDKLPNPQADDAAVFVRLRQACGPIFDILVDDEAISRFSNGSVASIVTASACAHRGDSKTICARDFSARYSETGREMAVVRARDAGFPVSLPR